MVIGILIAISINNWNEERKEKQKEIKSLVELNNNLLQNINEFNEFSLVQNRIIDKMSSLIKFKEAKVKYHDSLANYFRGINFLEQINLTTSSYETLKTNGLDLISSDTLRLKIIELYEVHYSAFVDLIKDVGLSLFSNDVVPISNKYYLLNERYDSNEYLYFLKGRIGWKTDAINNANLRKEQTEKLNELIELGLEKLLD